MIMDLRSAATCRYDLVSLGEVMLRLDPGAGRIRNARQFQVWEGGGEYNVARGLRRCFGLHTAIVTAFADNEVGRLAEDLILQGGVDTALIHWLAYDGIGLDVRNGLNFTERGFGVRGAVGVSDRGYTAAARLGPGAVDWDHLFGELGVRWFHTGGIYAALSDSSAELVAEAARAAHRHDVVTSYDLNYRPSLWRARGGQTRAQEVNRSLVGLFDVLLGNEEDFTACLGFAVPDTDAALRNLSTTNFETMLGEVTAAYPNLAVVATTLRAVHSASRNDWGAVAWSADSSFVRATDRPDLEIFDRVGGGDSFASGLIYGLLKQLPLEVAVEYGAAHGARCAAPAAMTGARSPGRPTAPSCAPPTDRISRSSTGWGAAIASHRG